MLEDEDDNEFENELIPDIRILRLHDGSDVIAFVVENVDDEYEDSHYMMTSPMIIEHTKSRQGKIRMNFKPWFWSSMVEPNQYYKLYHDSVLTSAVPSESMLSAYEHAYTALYGETVKSVPDTEEQTKEILDTMDRLEPSIKGNKQVKAFVAKELKRIMGGKGG